MCSEFCSAPKLDINYYGVLKLNKDSDDLQIKKAFRRLAIQYNPERRENDENVFEVFSLIAEAYEVLSDPLKRAIYDQYGETGLKAGVPSPNGFVQPYVFHGEPLRTFRNFFGTTSPYADLLDILGDPEVMRSFSEGRGVKCKDEPVIKPLQLSLTEVFYGAVKKMKIEKLVFMDPEESYTGMSEKILTIPIKPGLPTGTEIVFPEEGDQGPNRIPADIVFITSERPHEIFKREANDLSMIVDVFLKDALTGTVVKLETLDNRTLRIPITSIIRPGYRKLVPGEGLPFPHESTRRGDLIINFRIEFPVYFPVASKNYIRKAFEVAVKETNPDTDTDYIYRFILNEKIHRDIDRDVVVRRKTDSDYEKLKFTCEK